MKKYLNSKNAKIAADFPNFPYTPDLVPPDFHLLRPLQKFLAGKSFAHLRKFKTALQTTSSILKNSYLKGSSKKCQFVWCYGFWFTSIVWIKMASMPKTSVTKTINRIIQRNDFVIAIYFGNWLYEPCLADICTVENQPITVLPRKYFF